MKIEMCRCRPQRTRPTLTWTTTTSGFRTLSLRATTQPLPGSTFPSQDSPSPRAATSLTQVGIRVFRIFHLRFICKTFVRGPNRCIWWQKCRTGGRFKYHENRESHIFARDGLLQLEQFSEGQRGSLQGENFCIICALCTLQKFTAVLCKVVLEAFNKVIFTQHAVKQSDKFLPH